MAEAYLALSSLVWLFAIVAAVLLFLLPFFILRIRNELIDMNRRQKRMLELFEAVIPASKKPAVPEVPTKTCPNCKTINKMTAIRCSHCGDKFGLGPLT